MVRLGVSITVLKKVQQLLQVVIWCLTFFGGDPRLSGNTDTTGFYFYAFNVLSDPNFSYDGEVKVISTDLVNNTMVVDGGTWAQGDTVEYQTNGGQGDIISTDPDTNTLVVADTGDRDNRWIAENKAGTDFALAGPSIIDEPLLTTHVELESSQFATTPDGVDGLKEIIWNINNVDQSAGTLNPYRPTGLPLNSEVTIKVKHVANSIGESDWSTSTKFFTGASRTLKDHYMTRILELEQALAAAEAKPKRSRKKED